MAALCCAPKCLWKLRNDVLGLSPGTPWNPWICATTAKNAGKELGIPKGDFGNETEGGILLLHWIFMPSHIELSVQFCCLSRNRPCWDKRKPRKSKIIRNMEYLPLEERLKRLRRLLSLERRNLGKWRTRLRIKKSWRGWDNQMETAFQQNSEQRKGQVAS